MAQPSTSRNLLPFWCERGNCCGTRNSSIQMWRICFWEFYMILLWCWHSDGLRASEIPTFLVLALLEPLSFSFIWLDSPQSGAWGSSSGCGMIQPWDCTPCEWSIFCLSRPRSFAAHNLCYRLFTVNDKHSFSLGVLLFYQTKDTFLGLNAKHGWVFEFHLWACSIIVFLTFSMIFPIYWISVWLLGIGPTMPPIKWMLPLHHGTVMRWPSPWATNKTGCWVLPYSLAFIRHSCYFISQSGDRGLGFIFPFLCINNHLTDSIPSPSHVFEFFHLSPYTVDLKNYTTYSCLHP